MNRKIVVDIDGVLADLESSFCEQFGYDNRRMEQLTSRYPEHARSILEYINDPHSYYNLAPIPLGLEIVEYLNQYGFDVSIVTSRPVGSYTLTHSWLRMNGIGFSSLSCEPNYKVGRIKRISPLCAIDDFYSVYSALTRVNVPVIVFAQPWNRFNDKDMQRVSNLYEFTQYLSELTKRK